MEGMNQAGVTAEKLGNFVWRMRNALNSGTQLGEITAKLSFAVLSVAFPLTVSAGNGTNDGTHNAAAQNTGDHGYSLWVYLKHIGIGVFWGWSEWNNRRIDCRVADAA